MSKLFFSSASRLSICEPLLFSSSSTLNHSPSIQGYLLHWLCLASSAPYFERQRSGISISHISYRTASSIDSLNKILSADHRLWSAFESRSKTKDSHCHCAGFQALISSNFKTVPGALATILGNRMRISCKSTTLRDHRQGRCACNLIFSICHNWLFSSSATKLPLVASFGALKYQALLGAALSIKELLIENGISKATDNSEGTAEDQVLAAAPGCGTVEFIGRQLRLPSEGARYVLFKTKTVESRHRLQRLAAIFFVKIRASLLRARWSNHDWRCPEIPLARIHRYTCYLADCYAKLAAASAASNLLLLLAIVAATVSRAHSAITAKCGSPRDAEVTISFS